jgi:hypothetical protein
MIRAATFKGFVINESLQEHNFRMELDSRELNAVDEPTLLSQIINDQDPNVERLRRMGLIEETSVDYLILRSLIIHYEVSPVYDNYGIGDIDLMIKSMTMTFEYEYDGPSGEPVIEDIEIIDVGPFTDRIDITYGTLPLRPYEIEVDMNGGIDPKKFRYGIQLGEN